jgi:hypothetical protein
MNLSGFTGLLQGIGGAGADFAQGKLDADALKLKNLMDSLRMQEGTVNLDEAKERLKRLRGTPATPEEEYQQKLKMFRSVFGREPQNEQEKAILAGLQIAPAQPKITNEFEAWRESFKDRNSRYPSDTEIEEHHRREQIDVADKKVDIKEGLITDADGKTWDASDPNLPPELKKLYAANRKAHKEDLNEKAGIEARKNAEAIQKAIQLGDIREAEKQRMEVAKVVKRGINGHGFLRSVAQEVAAADVGGGVGTKFGDMNIAEGFMQLMFGLEPKALRGSPAMLETILKQSGGWDDRAIAEINKAYKGGRLSQEVRNQILEAATRQVMAWDQQVFQTGDLLSEDAKTKALVAKYRQKISEGIDLSDLGGTKVN